MKIKHIKVTEGDTNKAVLRGKFKALNVCTLGDKQPKYSQESSLKRTK